MNVMIYIDKDEGEGEQWMDILANQAIVDFFIVLLTTTSDMPQLKTLEGEEKNI